MTSRERVLAAIHHQTPDRVPADLGSTRQSGIAASTYVLLKELLGVSSPTKIYDVYQMIADVERPVLERFGIDAIGVQRLHVAFGIPNDAWKPWKLFDGTPVEVPQKFEPVKDEESNLLIVRDDEIIAKMPKNGFYFDRLQQYPGAAHVDLETFNPPLLDNMQLEHFRQQSKALYENTGMALVANMGPPYELFFGLGGGGFEDWMITLAMEPDYVHALYEKITNAWLENLKRFTDAVEDRIHVLQVCDDFGTQKSPFLSVKMFRDLIMPYYQRGMDWIHRHTDMKIMLHSDGAIYPLLPSIVEMGVDILNPVQTTAKGMQADRLKREFGDRLVFWGGACDVQHTMPFGTPNDVMCEVEENLHTLSPGGGFVFAPVHNIQANVPPENVVAMYDALKAFNDRSTS